MMGAEQERWLADGLRRSAGDKARMAGARPAGGDGLDGALAGSHDLAGWHDADAARGCAARDLRLAASRPACRSTSTCGTAIPPRATGCCGRRWTPTPTWSSCRATATMPGPSTSPRRRRRPGAEFAGHSVTSPGYEASSRADPADAGAGDVARNPQLKWADTSRRGYLTIELTPERATGEWLFLDTVRERSTALSGRHAMSVARGTNRFAGA